MPPDPVTFCLPTNNLFYVVIRIFRHLSINACEIIAVNKSLYLRNTVRAKMISVEFCRF